MARARLKIIRAATSQVIASDCVHAKDFVGRLVGLLNHKDLKAGEAMLIDPCKQVHSFFMAFSIDAIFLDRNNKVLDWVELPPWRLSKLHFRAQRVLEVPAGTCSQLGLSRGDLLEILPC